MAMQKYKQAAEGDHVCRLRGSHSLCASAVPQCAPVRCLRGMRSEPCTTCAQRHAPCRATAALALKSFCPLLFVHARARARCL